MKRILAYSLACLLSLSLLCTPASAAGIQNGAEQDAGTTNNYHIGYLHNYQGSSLRPNELLTRTEMAYMMYRLLDPNQLPDTLINYQPFTDIPSALDDHCMHPFLLSACSADMRTVPSAPTTRSRGRNA